MKKVFVSIAALGVLGVLLLEVGFLIFAYRQGLLPFLASLGFVCLANAALSFGANDLYTDYKRIHKND